MSDLLTSLFTKEQPWANLSRHSLQKSSVSESLLSLFKKEQCEWFDSDSSKSLAKNKWFARKFVFFICFDNFSPFLCPRANLSSLFAHLLFLKSCLNDLLPSLSQRLWATCSDCSWHKSNSERFAQVPHDIRVTVSDSLRSLMTKERPEQFPLSLTKNKQIAGKTDEQISNPDISLRRF